MMASAWGAAFGGAWGDSWGSIGAAVEVANEGGGSRGKRRGPYSDPTIYEAYIQRCIAEREKPKENVAAVELKKALVEQVEARWNDKTDEFDALIRENTILKALLEIERVKKNVAAIQARLQQIARQFEDEEEQQILSIAADFLQG